MRKFISNLVGMLLGALAILPPFCDDIRLFNIKYAQHSSWGIEIPVVVNSFAWVYAVIFIGLLISYFWFCDINLTVKLFSSYVYLTCFFSAAPYISFNAMLLLVPAFYMYLLVKKLVDKDIIINWIVALFWFEVAIGILQFFGRDVLMNFNRPQSIFLGTIMQHMRYGSLFAILTPFLLLKSRWYIIPLIVCAFLTYSSSFALALFAGIFVYICLTKIKYKVLVLSAIIILSVGHSFYNHGSFQTATSIGRIPVWKRIVWTGAGAHFSASKISAIESPIDSTIHIFKGRGLNHFTYLYPVMVEDANPFAQCHNDWLQIWWELGLIGLLLCYVYCSGIIKRLYHRKDHIWIVGLVVIMVNMFFAFPVYMPPQTPLILLCFLALCEAQTRSKDVVQT